MARLEWGADDKLWGAASLYWGAVDTVADPTSVPDIWFHALVKVSLGGGDLRVWTGLEDLEFDEEGTTNTWLGGGQVIEVGAISSHTITADDRLVLTFNSLREEYRDRWLVPVGPRPVEVRTIASEDYGVSWSILPQVKRGVMSEPTYSDGVYRFQVVHPFEVRQSLKPLIWSYENQLARYPGDRGLQFMRPLASGVEARWPFL